MAHVLPNWMALEVDTPLNRVEALSRALTVEIASTHARTDLLVSILDAETTHDVTISMFLGVNASTANTEPVSMALVAEALLTCAEADCRTSADATMTYAGPHLTTLALDTAKAHSGSSWIAFGTDALRAEPLPRALTVETDSTREGVTRWF